MAHREKNLTLIMQTKYETIYQTNKGWVVVAKDLVGKVTYIKAKILIDGTELGDVAALAGAKYDIGMDSRHTYNERTAPANANEQIQDLTYILTLKDYGEGADRSIQPPASYNKDLFMCACQQFCSKKQIPYLVACQKMMEYGQLPNQKMMLNWAINGNDYYTNMIELDTDARTDSIQKAKEHALNFLYFIQTELGYKHFGLALDEYPSEDKLPLIPYHRESRRIKGLATLTLNHIENPYSQAEKLYRTGIAICDYPIDQHHGKATNFQDVPISSFTVPLGSLLPKDVSNLIVVEKSISVSSLVNATTHHQPVMMEIGQAAGVLAALAIKQQTPLEYVAIRQVQEGLLRARGYLQPYIDVKPDDKHFITYQKIGSTGILKGFGKSNGLENKTFFYPDSTLTIQELWLGMKEYDADFQYIVSNTKQLLSVEEALLMILSLDRVADSKLIDFKYPDNFKNFIKERWQTEYTLQNFDLSRPITRGELAVLIEHTLDPFHLKQASFTGYLD
jgi:hypothetical protein